jgi:hypothetical protein
MGGSNSDELSFHTQVNGIAVTGMDVQDVFKLFTVPEGTDLTLQLRQPRSLRYLNLTSMLVCAVKH